MSLKKEEKMQSGSIDKIKVQRVTEILKDTSIGNAEKNKLARTIFKEITKGGHDGKTIKCVFWE